MSNYKTFELRRRNDDLVYVFDKSEKEGEVAYKRRDADLWITYRADFGWCAWDELNGALMGRSWQIIPKNQLGYPPEGVWVSKKDERSYVYDLIYINL